MAQITPQLSMTVGRELQEQRDPDFRDSMLRNLVMTGDGDFPLNYLSIHKIWRKLGNKVDNGKVGIL
jgi:hypothetical protein